VWPNSREPRGALISRSWPQKDQSLANSPPIASTAHSSLGHTRYPRHTRVCVCKSARLEILLRQSTAVDASHTAERSTTLHPAHRELEAGYDLDCATFCAACVAARACLAACRERSPRALTRKQARDRHSAPVDFLTCKLSSGTFKFSPPDEKLKTEKLKTQQTSRGCRNVSSLRALYDAVRALFYLPI
jgi:hypothetical protein